MGWHQDVPEDTECYFLRVMDYNYLVFLYFTTIITPALLLTAFYIHIYKVVLKQLRTIVTMNPENTIKGLKRRRAIAGGTMLRVLGAAQKREVKATQNLSIIVLFFMICWIPLYTINFILAICRDCIEANSLLMSLCIILSHINSAGNPVLYAYHLRDFRAALKNFLLGLVGKNHCHSNILTPGLNCRPSLISNTPIDANYSCRMTSWKEMQNMSNLSSLRNKTFLDTPINNELYQNDDGRLLIDRPRISSIVSGTAAVAFASADAGSPRRKMWRISEVPSTSDNSGNSQENDRNSCDIVSPNRRRTTSCGKSNGCYFGKFFFDEGDDDVFQDDFCEMDNKSIEKETKYGSEENLTSLNKVIVNRIRNKEDRACSSPQLSRNVFVIEDENRKMPKTSFPKFKNGLKNSLSGDCLSLYLNKSFEIGKTRKMSYNGSKGPPP